MGGIPHYLKELENGKSTIQNINEICFSPEGLLAEEFSRLYPALFDNAASHIGIIRALAKKWKGMSRKAILHLTDLEEGGRFSRILKELQYSSFISSYYPFGKKKKGMLYRLTDEYSLFYLHFIENRRSDETDVWQALSQTPIYRSWSGYAYESLCLKHISNIKAALKIDGIYAESSSFLFSGNDELPGTQIDLLIDRNDQVINLCEVKFSKDEFVITKDYAAKLRRKVLVFKEVTKTKKQISLTFITSFGIFENKHTDGLVDNDLTMGIFFS